MASSEEYQQKKFFESEEEKMLNILLSRKKEVIDEMRKYVIYSTLNASTSISNENLKTNIYERKSN